MAYDGPNPLPIVRGGTDTSSFTAHGPVIAGATSTSALSSVSPSATSGVPFISQGSSSSPAFGTAVVAGGGTGDTSFTAYGVVCGGTTSTGNLQAVTPGISGFLLSSGGSGGLPTWISSSSTGTLVLLSTQTASSSSSIAFTSLISATYYTYMLIITDLIPSVNNASVNMTISTNNGSTYITTNYNSGAVAAGGGTNAWAAPGAPITTNYPINGSIANSIGMSGTTMIYGLNNSGYKMFTSNNNYFNGTSAFVNLSYGYQSGSTVVNAIRIQPSSGTITSGVFSLYGIVD